jgi:hypothetical protein
MTFRALAYLFHFPERLDLLSCGRNIWNSRWVFCVFQFLCFSVYSVKACWAISAVPILLRTACLGSKRVLVLFSAMRVPESHTVQ